MQSSTGFPWVVQSGWSPWRVYALPGNHELWNGELVNKAPIKSFEQVFDECCRSSGRGGYLKFLQNELVIVPNGISEHWLDEQTLLKMNETELHDAVAHSAFTILGGMGFTGLDEKRGAAAGAYGFAVYSDGNREPRVSPKEDRVQSERFRALHDKLVRCAGNLPVIVATHTPMRCWSDNQPNPCWIYLHGHTHEDELVRETNGTTVIADNQIGYEPRQWYFKAFTHRCIYDPFDGWGDGVYEITGKQYCEFNYGRGIHLAYKGEEIVIMLKRDGVYMFLVETPRGLRWLMGGRKRVATHDIAYYYERLGEYKHCLEQALMPYRKTLAAIADEVHAFGGAGTAHGCIVDVDFYRHIYLNPFDGTLTPYLALNTVEKVAYSSVLSMLSGTVHEAGYVRALKSGRLHLLGDGGDESALATVPKLVLSTEIYRSSEIMRSVQYLFDKGVVRIWNDDVFKLQDSELPQLE